MGSRAANPLPPSFRRRPPRAPRLATRPWLLRRRLTFSFPWQGRRATYSTLHPGVQHPPRAPWRRNVPQGFLPDFSVKIDLFLFYLLQCQSFPLQRLVYLTAPSNHLFLGLPTGLRPWRVQFRSFLLCPSGSIQLSIPSQLSLFYGVQNCLHFKVCSYSVISYLFYSGHSSDHAQCPHFCSPNSWCSFGCEWPVLWTAKKDWSRNSCEYEHLGRSGNILTQQWETQLRCILHFFYLFEYFFLFFVWAYSEVGKSIILFQPYIYDVYLQLYPVSAYVHHFRFQRIDLKALFKSSISPPVQCRLQSIQCISDESSIIGINKYFFLTTADISKTIIHVDEEERRARGRFLVLLNT